MKIVELERKSIGEDVDISRFKDLGNFEIYETTSTDQFKDRAWDADIIIINKFRINKDTIGDGFENLKLVCLTATGFDNVDVEYCRSRGIAVCNAKGYSTNSVIQHTFATFFYIYEKLHHYDEYVKSGEYAKSDIFCNTSEIFNELYGKVWGVVGLGEIGRGVAKVAEAFGCQVVYYSTSGKNSNNNFERVEFDELLKISDVISIHAPLNDATRGMFSRDQFRAMKDSAYIINMGRGNIVNEADLADALNAGEIAGAALDVLSAEPIRTDNPLLTLKDSRKLLVTPHMAWGTYEARKRLMDEVYLNVKAFMDGSEKRNRVDLR
mgnify:CR=1 FL=1